MNYAGFVHLTMIALSVIIISCKSNTSGDSTEKDPGKNPSSEEVAGSMQEQAAGSEDLQPGAFEGSRQEAEYYAQWYYGHGVKLWDPQRSAYRLPDSALYYMNKALYYVEFCEAYNLLGQVKLQQGAMQDAVRAYNKAIELDPSKAQPYFNRGTAHYIMSNLPAACGDWKRADELGYPSARTALEMYCR